MAASPLRNSSSMTAVVKWMNADDPEAAKKMGEIALGVLAEMKKEKGETEQK